MLNAKKQVIGYGRHCAAISVVGAGLPLPFDVEPFGPGDGEDAADRAGIPVVARLKENFPELAAAVEKRFRPQPPTRLYRVGAHRVEIWDADDFDPWETLRGEPVRVIRYRQPGQQHPAEPICCPEPRPVLGEPPSKTGPPSEAPL